MSLFSKKTFPVVSGLVGMPILDTSLSSFDKDDSFFNDASFAAFSILGAFALVWGFKKMIDIVNRPSKLELFMYSYTIKSKRKCKKVKFRKNFNKKYILSSSRLKQITKYNQEQKEKNIMKYKNEEKIRQDKLNSLRKRYGLKEIDYSTYCK
ncbi:MAG: hypothetical protein WC279_06725 [Sulfurimonas sp.]|jgi:uncharacterized membrane protein YhiD involved in acid resistance|uniref:hypothetical protein n=1 Tax=Sulfurimonas sp. TaxID=2022749 RepID=UPI001BC378F8|nr:hypothetical protein [Sulfurimonas sp.]MDX9756956.1 hypothetical protein [Sulfurimonas sp.]